MTRLNRMISGRVPSTVITFIEARLELGVLGEIETELIPYGD